MPYPPAPTTFDEVIKMVPHRGEICKHRFMLGDKPIELTIGRSDSDFVFLELGMPDPHFEFYRGTRTVEGMMTQRQILDVWQKFLADPDDDLTSKRFAVKVQS
jgi:hypothetical protein